MRRSVSVTLLSAIKEIFSSSDSSESVHGEESDTQQCVLTGQLAYTIEPEYTLQELQIIIDADQEKQNKVDKNSRKDTISWCERTKCESMRLFEECKCCKEFSQGF